MKSNFPQVKSDIFKLRLHRILNCRITGRRISGHFFLPDTGYPARYPAEQLPHNFFFYKPLLSTKLPYISDRYFTLIFYEFQTSWTVSLVYVLFQFICLLFLIQNSFSGRISGKRNRISGRIPDTKKGRISGATLFLTLTMINGSQLKILPLK